MKLTKLATGLLLATSLLSACSENNNTQNPAPTLLVEAQSRLDIYKTVTLSADLSHLSENQKQMIVLLIEASDIIDELFWQQAFGEDKETFLASIEDEKAREFARINYGPWDRLDGDKPFLSGYEAKALGAEFYPSDLTKEEFEKTDFEDKDGLYSVVQRNSDGQLTSVAYSELYSDSINRIAAILEKASSLADDKEFAHYLNLRATAMRHDDFQASDFAWMDMKNNPIDVVIGPIETYEDLLHGSRTAFESYVLIKDLAWSAKLAKYAEYLPELQKGLPVKKAYKKEIPGSDADLNAYDVIYYAGHSNAGSKTIAINLPNDEVVQLEKGTRRLQLKNAMQAKFDTIMLPIASTLIVPEQRENVTFTAFFANTMFHEVAHGLGIKNTINNKGTVRESLKELASALEEGKADILGLYMIRQLLIKGVIEEGTLQDYYTTFLAGIFRSVRFGASSAHGKANMVRFNYFAEQEAFTRNAEGLYSVNIDKMTAAIDSLSELILTLQGNGDYDSVAALVAKSGVIKANLAEDLARIEAANIPVDITFKQGKKVLGL
ncbi:MULTISPECIES: dipeptidyl-peptidase 3 family protein [unclassified Colwellia]|uniref:dipeptidyl-peptidase 3 family protein n=1 Tax=unclassified Colwellia TaxID=196834 RepID=UPI0015F78668|nr:MULTISPECIES: Zn-dependent hydrolase [unclassified Colwellia]MBA6232400.1 Zn-dependent hydrolase [Colwellia sp. MB02u-7]MBA6238257.1 Zn-dependent hydrolase [Colwellia sp. MB02u-11]MBA6254535.1 Zn-dependent hydrolase [Colwellia sp. MB3u-28]MBA6258294.1 Zn-dependent hydrolase [Colwellia sp. MB3u-41]MBA6301007.1 Zn-dependent hydrolase [Colwellia sp. MB3u-22]